MAINMLEISFLIGLKDMELIIMQMEIILEENLKIVNQMDMEFIYINLGLEQEIDLKEL